MQLLSEGALFPTVEVEALSNLLQLQMDHLPTSLAFLMKTWKRMFCNVKVKYQLQEKVLGVEMGQLGATWLCLWLK